ncbi:uncharacterized protein C8R40DRAFT_1116790 [Lentinula edodes]|uniref:uncharacterized protein n=1 Tax=Lentinula edodes TaxID=5353 RepID=UPI001E8CD2B8|nr:uncharacterized protein C8R40DRAFT_1116790 [Lentinula edodes]KAH7872416.1 hypothetical protein C8R40DRAFT_1116790 [Lentinula edodes]
MLRFFNTHSARPCWVALKFRFTLICGLLFFLAVTTAIPLVTSNPLEVEVGNSAESIALSLRTRTDTFVTRSVSVEFTGGVKPTMRKTDHRDIQGAVHILLQASLPVLDENAHSISIIEWAQWPKRPNPTRSDSEEFTVRLEPTGLSKLIKSPTVYKGYLWLEDGIVSGRLTMPPSTSREVFSSNARKIISGEKTVAEVIHGVLVYPKVRIVYKSTR